MLKPIHYRAAPALAMLDPPHTHATAVPVIQQISSLIVWVATVATSRPFGHAMAGDGTDRRGYRLA